MSNCHCDQVLKSYVRKLRPHLSCIKEEVGSHFTYYTLEWEEVTAYFFRNGMDFTVRLSTRDWHYTPLEIRDGMTILSQKLQ
jgi:hypothetical protein